VANADCAGRQEVDGRLRFSSGAGAWHGDPSEWTENSLAPSASDIRSVVDRVAHVLPIAAKALIARTWGGLIDLTPDALPVIDAPESPAGLVIAAGFSGHGFCLGPVSGLLCADLALGRVPRHDLSAFRLARFARRVTTPAEPTLHG
jgi:sarcosine oxidase subunit beta